MSHDEVRRGIWADVRSSFASESSRAGKNALLTDACLVVDGLGEDAKSVHLACTLLD